MRRLGRSDAGARVTASVESFGSSEAMRWLAVATQSLRLRAAAALAASLNVLHALVVCPFFS